VYTVLTLATLLVNAFDFFLCVSTQSDEDEDEEEDEDEDEDRDEQESDTVIESMFELFSFFFMCVYVFR
jgi:hypothetical protein